MNVISNIYLLSRYNHLDTIAQYIHIISFLLSIIVIRYNRTDARILSIKNKVHEDRNLGPLRVKCRKIVD